MPKHGNRQSQSTPSRIPYARHPFQEDEPIQPIEPFSCIVKLSRGIYCAPCENKIVPEGKKRSFKPSNPSNPIWYDVPAIWGIIPYARISYDPQPSVFRNVRRRYVHYPINVPATNYVYLDELASPAYAQLAYDPAHDNPPHTTTIKRHEIVRLNGSIGPINHTFPTFPTVFAEGTNEEWIMEPIEPYDSTLKKRRLLH